MQGFIQYLHYFRSFSKSHVAMRYFVTGDFDRILHLDRTKIDYPCLWLETPEIVVRGDQIRYHGAWVMLKSVVADDWTKQDQARDITFRLAEDLLQRMRDDAARAYFTIEGDPRLEEISTLTHNNDYGWRCTFTIVKHKYKCLPAFYHHNKFPLLLSLFSYKHDYISTGFENLTFTNLSEPEKTDLSYQWIFRHGDEDPTYFTEKDPPPYTNYDTEVPLTVQLLVGTIDGKFSNKSVAVIKAGVRAYGYSYPEPLTIEEPIM